MANLYILPHPFFALFLLLASFLFLTEAVLCYYRWPRRHVQPREQILSEGCSLLLLFVYISLLFDVWNDQVWGLLYVHFLENTRLAAASFGLGISLYGLCRRQWDNVVLLAASIFLLPWCDRFLPWSLLIVFLLFGGRIFFLLPPAYRAARLTVTERSIQEAVDRLDDGIFISLDRGEPVLVNQTMQRVMQDILGVYVRNGNIFWHLLMHFPRKGKIRKEEQGNALLFHLPSGQAWLLRRVYLSMPGRTGWQITASEVSEWVRVNQKISQTRKVLKKRNAALRRLLHDVGEIQGRETTIAVKSKIHDLMGQRITMLQQLLNNQNDVTYAQIAPLVQNIFADIQADIEVEPDQRLRDLLQAYRSLGVTIEVKGGLPAETAWAREWVRIIREGLTNALSHGQATAVYIEFTDAGYTLCLRDNGIGCQRLLTEGTGLSAMRQRVRALGGSLHFTLRPHFIITARAKEENHDSLNDRR